MSPRLCTKPGKGPPSKLTEEAFFGLRVACNLRIRLCKESEPADGRDEDGILTVLADCPTLCVS